MHKLFSMVIAAAALTACSTDWTAIDMDGDGVPFSEDCDEANAEIGPGMAEIWYDGIDQNCDGNDADQDLDGFVWDGVGANYDWQAFEAHVAVGDCWDDPADIPADYAIVASEGWEQPAAAEVNPDAEDTWYDGPDQDCGANSDFDQDGDGYDTTEYPRQDGSYGDDCVDGSDRDENPLECDRDPDDAEEPEEVDLDDLLEDLEFEPADVNPGATDAWYDGLDQDCSGNNDFDFDGDGYGNCADCDDLDAERFPTGAIEIWYDCVDDNCDNNDGDQDLDGFVVEGYEAACPEFEGHNGFEYDDCWDDPTNRPTDFEPLNGYPDIDPENVNADATDVPYDGIDADCAGDSDFDADEDGQDTDEYAQRDDTYGDDCDDSNNDIYDGAPETCDSVDSDCDGDLNDSNSLNCGNYYYDGDEDDYGVEPARCYCEPHATNGWTSEVNTDCDDVDPDDYPGATEEIDNNDDEDCDGNDLCYVDSDGDGYGDEDGSTVVGDGDLECDEASQGEANDTDDCDDTDEDTFPGAAPNDSYTACMNDDDYDDYGDDSAPSGVTDGTDCDDTDSGDYPGADETVDNGDDEDCDGGDLCYVDDDGDGYGDNDNSTTTGNGDLDCDDSGEADDTDDCHDGNDDAYPGAAYNESSTSCMEDRDGDGYGDDEAPSGVTDGTDCDDTDSGDYPGATETVNNGDDEDCDGGDTCYVDDDGDGYGDDSAITTTGNGDLDCDDKGEADDTNDCDDSDSGDYPGASETVANGDDEDCDGVDTCYVDSDGDDYGDDDGSTVVGDDLDCDEASKGEADDMTDCDDSDSGDYPGASETVANGDDEDCDGNELCYEDDDKDGYGSTTTKVSTDLDCNDSKESSVSTDCWDKGTNDDETYPGAAASDSTTSCMTDYDGDGYGDDSPVDSGITAGTDCDDNSSSDYPGATETVANGDDEDCDGADTCYVDSDGDDYGDDDGSTVVGDDLDCDEASKGEADDMTDCDDGDEYTHPKAAPEEENGTDCMTDADEDDWGSETAPSGGSAGTDCDDDDQDISPGATETTADGIDQDCDGVDTCYVDSDGDDYGSTTTQTGSDLTCANDDEADDDDDCDDGNDDAYPGAAYNESSTSCMEDRDGDGYGDDDAPSGVTDGTDCNDDDADVNPGESEIIANEVDDNCDGTEVCYADVDEDGYGDSSSYENSTSDEDCDDAGEATSTTDCDDSDEYTHPNAASKDGAACMTDADEDNWGSETAPSGGSAGTDCDDDDEDVNPDGTETVGNDVDEDCDDEAECYYDADEDGDGTEFGTTYNNGDEDCNDTNEASTKTDCDDTDDTRAGTNSETTSNDIDDDCDDVIDEGSYSGGEVVISEIHNDPKYSDGGEEFDGEWFELYNTSASDDYYLGGWQIDLGPGSGSRFYVGIDSNLMVASQSYVVLCYDDVTLGSKCDYVYGSTQSWESDKGATYNGNAKLANNYADDGDTVALTVGSTTIDSVKYTTGNYFSEPTSGNSIELGDDYLDDNDNDVGSYWCESDDTDTGFMYYDGTATNDEYGTPQTSASCTPTP